MSLDNIKQRLAGLSAQQRLGLMVAIALLLALALLYTFAAEHLQRMAQQRAAREKTLVEMMSLKVRYQSAQKLAQRISNRMASVKANDSPSGLMEEIGIKGKNLQVRSLPQPVEAGGREEVAEVRIDGVTANEMVNLLYRLEKGSRPVSVRKASIKTRFDDPSRLDLILTIALQKRIAALP